MKNSNWPFNICLALNCSRAGCKKLTGKDCEGQFWIKSSGCINFAEHLNLNLNTSNFAKGYSDHKPETWRGSTKRRKGARIK